MTILSLRAWRRWPPCRRLVGRARRRRRPQLQRALRPRASPRRGRWARHGGGRGVDLAETRARARRASPPRGGASRARSAAACCRSSTPPSCARTWSRSAATRRRSPTGSCTARTASSWARPRTWTWTQWICWMRRLPTSSTTSAGGDRSRLAPRTLPLAKQSARAPVPVRPPARAPTLPRVCAASRQESALRCGAAVSSASRGRQAGPARGACSVNARRRVCPRTPHSRAPCTCPAAPTRTRHSCAPLTTPRCPPGAAWQTRCSTCSARWPRSWPRPSPPSLCSRCGPGTPAPLCLTASARLRARSAQNTVNVEQSDIRPASGEPMDGMELQRMVLDTPFPPATGAPAAERELVPLSSTARTYLGQASGTVRTVANMADALGQPVGWVPLQGYLEHLATSPTALKMLARQSDEVNDLMSSGGHRGIRDMLKTIVERRRFIGGQNTYTFASLDASVRPRLLASHAGLTRLHAHRHRSTGCAALPRWRSLRPSGLPRAATARRWPCSCGCGCT
jgi:hypothetical protein